MFDFFDGLQNAVSRLGLSRDKGAANEYVYTPLSVDQIQCAFRESWVAKKIIKIPAMDTCREWRDWQADAKQITDIENEEKRLGIKVKFLRALILARLEGGSAILIGDGSPNTSEPLDPTKVKKGGLKYVTVLPRTWLSAEDLSTNPESEFFAEPEFFNLSANATGELRVHASRLVILRGEELFGDSVQTDGFGDSVLQSTLKAVSNLDGSSANVASLIFEAKVDVFKIPGLMKNIGDKRYEEKLVNRFELANMTKGVNGALMLDSNEEYDQKSANFGNLSNILDKYMQLVSGAADIPVTRLMGQSPAGMDATGEGDLKNYYDKIRAEQELVLQPQMSVLDECLIYSALGSRPSEVHYNWASLWQQSDKEKQETGKIATETMTALDKAGLLPSEVASKTIVNVLTELGAAPGLEEEMAGFYDENGGFFEEDDLAERGASVDETVVADSTPRTLYVSRRLLNTKEFVSWAKSQGLTTTDNLHVTLAYSRTPVNWMKMGAAWNERTEVPAGGPRAVERFGTTIVLEFKSPMLEWRHEEMRENGADWDWDEYRPHVSITYEGDDIDPETIEPYQGKLVFGPEIFTEIKE